MAKAGDPGERVDALLTSMADKQRPSTPGWRKRISVGPEAVSRNTPGIRYINLTVGYRLATELARVAEKQNISRQMFMRRVLANEVSRLTGIPYDTLFETAAESKKP